MGELKETVAPGTDSGKVIEGNVPDHERTAGESVSVDTEGQFGSALEEAGALQFVLEIGNCEKSFGELVGVEESTLSGTGPADICNTILSGENLT